MLNMKAKSFEFKKLGGIYMEIIAAIFSSTTLILIGIAADHGFRFRDLILYWQQTPLDKSVPPLEVLLPLIRVSGIISIWFIYLAWRQHKTKDKK